MDDNQIKQMVSRFLVWRLPENFQPDGGISFNPMFNEHTDPPMQHEPSGTNLLNYQQAEAMVRHMVEGIPETQAAVAAALMQAAEKAFNVIANYPLRTMLTNNDNATMMELAILAIIPADAMAALDAVKAEARREVLDELNDVLPTGWVGQPHCSNMDYGPNVAVAARAIISAMRAAMEAKP